MAVYSIAVAADNCMDEFSPTTNFGIATETLAGDEDAKTNQTWRALYTFDLTGFPGVSADITAVTLDFWQVEYVASGSVHTHALHRLTRADWHETQSNWNIFKTANNWTTAGGDYAATPKHTWTPGTGASQIQTIPSSTEFIDLVKDAIDTRSGFLYLLWKEDDESDTTNQTRVRAASDEHTTQAAPVLNITYPDPPAQRRSGAVV